MLKWLTRLLGGPKHRPAAKTESTGLIFQASKPTTVHLPKDAPKPDLSALAQKYAKAPNRKRHRKTKNVRPVPNGHHGGKRP